MNDLSKRVEIDLGDISAVNNTTSPRIAINLEANPDRNDVEVVDITSDLTFSFNDSDEEITAPAPRVRTATIGTFDRHGTTFWLEVDFTRHDLDEIERLREGETFNYTLSYG